VTTAPHREPVRVLVLSASLRRDSLSSRLARLTADCFAASEAFVTVHSMAEFTMPLYDQDVEDETGMPAGAEALKAALLDHDAFVIVSPEYNGSMPGSLKNAIDWLSRFRPQPFTERQCLLLSSSPSMIGGNRGLWALRMPLEHLGTRVYPDMFSLAQAHNAFDDNGQLKDQVLHGRLQATVTAFTDLVEAAKHYPCVKSGWIEFLGERADPAIDRVDHLTV
jgi:chromate reductase, NAD(P)H dehydrogenase (quinone)